MEPKKISFGFSKISKKSNLLPTKESAKPDTKVELIKYLEGQEIKLVVEKPVEKPLTIPLLDSQKTSTALASLLKRRAVLLGEDDPIENNCSRIETLTSAKTDELEDIEKRAARELLAETQKTSSAEVANNLVLPVVKPDDLVPLEGAKESTLNDYENIPILDFGKAMLRGMGWTDPLPKVGQNGGPPKDDTPTVRPKGMGLGADKALKKKPFLVAPEANEVLEIKRNAFVRILGGKHKDLYGQIEGFDDHAGRVIVKLAIGGAKESYNEFLCQAVSKKEYAQYGKCINSSKYEEYKKKENEYRQIILDKNDKNIREKPDKGFKKESQESDNDKDIRHKDDYKRSDKYGSYKEEKSIKQEKDIVKKEERQGVYFKYDAKNRSTDDMKETNRNPHRVNYDSSENHRRKNDDRSPKRQYTQRDDQRYRRPEEKYRSSRRLERSTSKERDRQRRHRDKTGDDSSDSESVSCSSKHTKSKSSHSKKKSKKSKKGKSKYKNATSDSETTSSSSEFSSSEEERRKKHKKKTKKSKKQFERSRSRGRR